MPIPHPYLDTSTPVPIAHRGGAGTWPENTMPAFQGAVDLGFQYVETDVHATADGVLVAFHDNQLDRVTDQVGKISELAWSDVQKALVDGREPIQQRGATANSRVEAAASTRQSLRWCLFRFTVEKVSRRIWTRDMPKHGSD